MRYDGEEQINRVVYVARLTLFAAAMFGIGAGLLGAALTTRAASLYIHPARLPSEQTPAAVGLAYQDIELRTSDGLQLAAWYVPAQQGLAPHPPLSVEEERGETAQGRVSPASIPGEGQKSAALILLHGLGVNRGQMVAFARHFADHGYGSLLVDLRAHGASDGQTSTLSVREVEDVRAALAHLRARPEVDPERIGVFGVSLGAATAIMAAAELPELKAVVADSGFASIEWLVEHQMSGVSQLPSWMSPLLLWVGSLQAGVLPHEIAPIRRVARISPRPLLIIHGERDTFFLADNSRLLFEEAREPKQLWLVPGARHAGAYGRDPARYLERVQDFFDEAL